MARRILIGTARGALTIGGVLAAGGTAGPAVIGVSMVLDMPSLPPMPEPPSLAGKPADPPAARDAVAPSPPAAGGAPTTTRRSLGLYEQQSACLSAGNAGQGAGEWNDCTCTGSYGAWYIRPQ